MLRNKEKSLLYGANIWYLGEGMFGPLFAVFAERVGGDILEITWAWAAYLFTTGILYIVIGRISDKYVKKEKLMVAGYALNAVFTFAYLLVSNPSQLLLVQVGLGVASAMATPTWNALYAEYENKKQAGFIWGLADGESSLITGVAIILGGLIVTYGSFTALFVLMGIVQIIATVYQARILKIR